MQQQPSTRSLTGIDGGRFIASLAVVVLHCLVWDSFSSDLLNQICRFAVPFFFITSGYFFYPKTINPGQTLKVVRSCTQILLLFLTWSLLYAIDAPARQLLSQNVFQHVFGSLSELWADSGPRLILVGTAKHLWFLPSLGLAMGVAFASARVSSMRLLGSLAVACFLGSLILGPYSWVLGERPSFFARNGICFSLPCFSSGMLIRHAKFTLKKTTLYVALPFLFTAQLVEATIISDLGNINVSSLDFTILTLPLGACCFLLFQHYSFPQSIASICAETSLGIYFIHPLVYKHIQFLRGHAGGGFGDAALLTTTVTILSLIITTLYFSGLRFLRSRRKLT